MKLDRKYVVSWYENGRLLTTQSCKTFTSYTKATEYYAHLKTTKQDEFGNKISRIILSQEMEI